MTSTSFFIFWIYRKRAHAPLGLWQFNDHSRKPGPGLGSIPSSTKFLFQSVGPEAPLKAHLSTSERGRPHTSARAFLFSKQSWDHNFLVDPLAEGAKPRQRFFKSAFFWKPLWKTLHSLQVYAVWLTKVPLCLLIGILPGHVLQLTFTVIMSWPPTFRLLRLFWAASLSFSPKPGRAKPTGASIRISQFFPTSLNFSLKTSVKFRASRFIMQFNWFLPSRTAFHWRAPRRAEGAVPRPFTYRNTFRSSDNIDSITHLKFGVIQRDIRTPSPKMSIAQTVQSLFPRGNHSITKRTGPHNSFIKSFPANLFNRKILNPQLFIFFSTRPWHRSPRKLMFLRPRGNLDGRDPPDFSFTNLFLIESLGSFEPDAAVCPPKVPGLLKLKSEAVQPPREASSCLRFLEWAVTPPRDRSSDLLGPSEPRCFWKHQCAPPTNFDRLERWT